MQPRADGRLWESLLRAPHPHFPPPIPAGMRPTFQGEQRVIKLALHLTSALGGAGHPEPFVEAHGGDDSVTCVGGLLPLRQGCAGDDAHPATHSQEVAQELKAGVGHGQGRGLGVPGLRAGPGSLGGPRSWPGDRSSGVGGWGAASGQRLKRRGGSPAVAAAKAADPGSRMQGEAQAGKARGPPTVAA